MKRYAVNPISGLAMHRIIVKVSLYLMRAAFLTLLLCPCIIPIIQEEYVVCGLIEKETGCPRPGWKSPQENTAEVA